MQEAASNASSRKEPGTYDGQPTFDAISDASPPKSKPKVIINPHKPTIPDKGEEHGATQRELHFARIAEIGQMEWEKETDYGLRSLGETAIFWIKALTEGWLTARTFGTQQSEISIKIVIAIKAIRAAKPVSIRIQ